MDLFHKSSHPADAKVTLKFHKIISEQATECFESKILQEDLINKKA